MNLREHAVLEGIYAAGYHRKDFWATAEEIAAEIRTNEHLADARKVLWVGRGQVTSKVIGYWLRRMHSSPNLGIRGEVLVKKRRVQGVNQWQATREAVRATCV